MRLPRPKMPRLRRRTESDFNPSFSHPAFSYQPPSYLMWLKIGLGAFLVLATVSILWVLIWFFMASQFRGAVVEWFDTHEAQGWTAGNSRAEVGGFPLWLRVELSNPRIGPPDKAWRWSADRAFVRARLWSPSSLEIGVETRQSLSMRIGGAQRTFTGRAKSFSLFTDASAEWPPSWGLATRELNLRGAGSSRIAARKLEGRMMPPEDPRGGTILTLHVAGEGLVVPRRFGLPMGDEIASLDADARLQGRIRPPLDAVALTRWRDDGGTIEVDRLETTYGPLRLALGGTLALDGNLQPTGAFTARVRGFFETLTALERRRLIRARDAVTAKLVLGALAKHDPKTNAPVLSIPLTLQERKIFAGPVPLAQVPAVTWPGMGKEGEAVPVETSELR